MITPNAEIRALEPFRAKQGTVYAAASRAAASHEARRALRLSAIAADASAMTEVSLSLLWCALKGGTSSVVDGFFSEDRCYVVLSPKADESGTPGPHGGRLEILEAVLSGVRQKNLAIDLAIAPSTVAMNCRLALASLGVNGIPSRAHPLLMMAARAQNDPGVALGKCATFIGRDARELRVIGAPRPDGCLSALLPSAELAVIRSVVEGLSHQEIALRRGTSTRTIANQINSVFRRLRVSSRNELVQRLLVDYASDALGSGPVSETLMPSDAAPLKPVAGTDEARRSA